MIYEKDSYISLGKRYDLLTKTKIIKF